MNKIINNKSSVEVSCVADVAQPIISSVTVTDPKGDGEYTKILYSADNVVAAGYDYIFNDVPDADGRLKCKLPFSGTISVSEKYEIVKVDLLNSYFALNRSGETVVYQKEDYSETRLSYKISNNTNNIEWSFNEDWNAYLHVGKEMEEIYDIIAKISLVVRKINDDGTRSDAFKQTVFFTSEYSGETINSIKVMPRISIDVKVNKEMTLRSVFTSSLNEARCYASSGVAPLSDGKQIFVVAGGSCGKSLQYVRQNTKKIDEFTIGDMPVLKRSETSATLSQARYRTSCQVMKNTDGKQYFVSIGGGLGDDRYSNRIDVFEINADGTLKVVNGQTELLPSGCDHTASVVVNHDGIEYLIVAGGYIANNNKASNSVLIYTINNEGLLKKNHMCTISEAVYGAAIGIIANENCKYLLIAGGINDNKHGSPKVNIFKIGNGCVLSLIKTLDLSVGRGDAAYGVLQDEAGNQCFVVAGGRTISIVDVEDNYASDVIDVFCFNDEGDVIRIDNQPKLKKARFDIAAGVMYGKYFVAAGGYISGTDCSDVIDVFCIGQNGLLEQKNPDVLGIALKEKTAAGVCCVLSDKCGSYFVVAGGAGQSSVTDKVEMFLLKDGVLQRVFVWHLQNSRVYAGFGVATLSGDRQSLIIAGGAKSSGIDVSHTDSLANIEVLILQTYSGASNLCVSTELNKDKYRTIAQVVKDKSKDDYYFVVAGGYSSDGYSDEIEVFKVDDGDLNKISQTVKLPKCEDHMSSVVVRDRGVDYLVIVGGFYCDKNLSVYSIDNGNFFKCGDSVNFEEPVFGAAVGVIRNNGKQYVIVAGGIKQDNGGSNRVYVYKFSEGTLITEDKTSINVGRGDMAYGTIKDRNGKEYFIVAGGRCANSYSNSSSSEIDVFCYNENVEGNGSIVRLDNSMKLSSARFDIASGVIGGKYFVTAGGYLDHGSSVCDSIEVFSVGTDGILKLECTASLKEPVASATANVISDGEKHYFVIAGGSSRVSTTSAVEVFELDDGDLNK